jgi:hypothetical protein
MLEGLPAFQHFVSFFVLFLVRQLWDPGFLLVHAVEVYRHDILVKGVATFLHTIVPGESLGQYPIQMLLSSLTTFFSSSLSLGCSCLSFLQKLAHSLHFTSNAKSVVKK